jgi:1,2-dihydroxy-3-keto-5-methylthiopentene dioxygenase
MKAYYFDNLEGEHNLPHEGKSVSVSELKQIGVEYHFIPTGAQMDEKLKEFCSKRSYKNHDQVIISPTSLSNYEEKMKMFYEEYQFPLPPAPCHQL